MKRAKTVEFLRFAFTDGGYRFDYRIDEDRYSIDLAHTSASPLPQKDQRVALFNLGMSYLLDLMELVIPEQVTIDYSLSPKQLEFWQTLYQEVSREKMYKHKLDLSLLDADWQANVQGESFGPIMLRDQKTRALCLTGGKESLTLLKLLKDQRDILLFFLNPETNVHRQKVYERVKSEFRTVKTISNRWQIIREIKQKHQTTLGSGVDTAHLIFNTMLLGSKYVIIGNEYSSNYPNLMYQGYMVNHQYIKSLHFAQKINAYLAQCVTKDFAYYSPFFGLYEIKIASRLFDDPEFLEVWTSCNKANPDINFCSNCAKCAFTYLVSLLYTSEEFLRTYFSHDMLQNVELFKPMQDFTGEKPLDCVGEKIEVWTALNMLAQRPDQADKPVVRYFTQVIRPLIAHELPHYQREVFAVQTVPAQLPPELASTIASAYGS